MTQFFSGMPGLLQGFWWVALIASIIFVLQTIMTFIGSDSGADGVNADFEGDLEGVHTPFQMFTFRNLVNFMLGFGWTGIAFYNTITNKTILVLLATLVGVIFILLFFFIIKQFLKLSEDNTFDIMKLVGYNADVYLNIPSNMSGQGKVQVSFQGTSHELPAMTQGEMIPTGSVVKIISINQKILIVNKIS
ncbi:MAG: serine protease [Niabella sp.]